MAFDLGSKFTKKASQYSERATGRLLPGNDLISKTARGFLDAQSSRLLQAGLDIAGQNPFLDSILSATFRDNDTRVRIGLSPKSGPILYKDSSNKILAPLNDTDGVLFPYTPNINVAHSANYAGMQPTHSNYIQHSYGSSSTDSIAVVGMFTANTADEARYMMAVLHFMRSAHKMFFGQDKLRGTPPPVLRLSGYGPYQFNSVPVVVQAFSHDFEGSSDYIEVPLAAAPDSATKTMVPTMMNINFSLLPIYTRNQIGEFSLDEFARGNKIGNPSKGGGFI